jgi:hypothetical protein
VAGKGSGACELGAGIARHGAAWLWLGRAPAGETAPAGAACASYTAAQAKHASRRWARRICWLVDNAAWGRLTAAAAAVEGDRGAGGDKLRQASAGAGLHAIRRARCRHDLPAAWGGARSVTPCGANPVQLPACQHRTAACGRAQVQACRCCLRPTRQPTWNPAGQAVLSTHRPVRPGTGE